MLKTENSFITKTPLILLMSAFTFSPNISIFGENSTFTQNNSMRAVPTWNYRHFLRCRVSLVNFFCWFKFHVNSKAGSGVMTIFFYKRLTRNPEIENNSVSVLSHIWRLGQVRDTKFFKNVSNKKLVNAAKCQLQPLPFLSY